jgi:DNA excision repair protein ERCC-2
VSLGLPPHDDYHREMQRQFSKRFGIENAYSYTFLIPAMRKVIQAAGRLLRNETDYGLIELIDQRFEQPEIKALLPTWWF